MLDFLIDVLELTEAKLLADLISNAIKKLFKN